MSRSRTLWLYVSSGEYGECRDASVTLSDRQVLELLKLRGHFARVKRTIKALDELSMHDSRITYYTDVDTDQFSEQDVGVHYGGEFVVVGDNAVFPAPGEKGWMSCDASRLVVCKYGVFWKAYPRHSSEEMSTTLLTWTDLEKLAGK